jgi:hypothetical protein
VKVKRFALILFFACGPAPASVELTGTAGSYVLAATGGHAIAHVSELTVSGPCHLSVQQVAKTVAFTVVSDGGGACTVRADVTLDDGQSVMAVLPL